MKYEVRVKRICYLFTDVDVEADSDAEAKRKAIKEVRESEDVDFYWDMREGRYSTVRVKLA